MKIVAQLHISDGFLMLEVPGDGYGTETEVYKSQRAMVTLPDREIETLSDGRTSALSRMNSYEFYDDMINKLQLELSQKANSREIGRELDTIEVETSFRKGRVKAKFVKKDETENWY